LRGTSQETETYGRRFLDEWVRLGGLRSSWSYAALTALEEAGRAEAVALLRKNDSLLPYRIIACAETDSPEALAKAVMDELSARGQGAAGAIAGSCMLF
jgi:hypothetical protein